MGDLLADRRGQRTANAEFFPALGKQLIHRKKVWMLDKFEA